MTKYKCKSNLYILPMVMLFVIIMIIYYNRYIDTVNIIKSEYESKLEFIEESVYNETKYTEIISEILETDINHIMEENSQLLVDEYKKNPNIFQWDFNEMKKQLNMDIYILDNNLEVVASSIDEEVGLNFNEHPHLYNILYKRLKGNKFESDKINFSIIEGELRKYSYEPTHDNKYLIELSVNIKDLYPDLKNLNIVYLSEDLKNGYSFVEDIRVYKFNMDRENSHELDTANTNITTDIDEYIKKDRDKYRDKYVKKALETNKPQEQLIEDNNNSTYRLKYIPYIGTEYFEENEVSSWESYVIEVLYNEQNMKMRLLSQRKKFLISIIVVAALYFSVGFIIIKLVQKNRQIADRDHLTKLPSRKKFEEIIKYKILSLKSRNKNKNNKIAILFFDLDKFKNVNDTFGHDFGDKVLQEVANKIKNELRKEDIVSRLGGDEFTASISGFKSEKDIIEVVDRIASVFETSLKIGSEEIFIKPSIGVSIYPDHGETVEVLILKADDAMYRAKQKGRGYEIYRKESNI